MKTKFVFARAVLTGIFSTMGLLVLFQNCAPMSGELPFASESQDNSSSVGEKLIGVPLIGKQYLNTCGDAPDFPVGNMCAQWYSSEIDGFISIAVNDDGKTFEGTSTCFDFSGSFESTGANYRDKKNVLISPASFELGPLTEKPGCNQQLKTQEQTRILELGLATGFSFYNSGSIGIETPSGRLLLR